MSTLTNFVTRGGRRLRRAVYAGLPAARVNEIASLAQLASLLPRIRVPVDTSGIRGWLSADEQRALYALGALAQSPVLEIGSWVGLSTVCLAQGILASGLPKQFVTCELNPTLANFRELADGRFAFDYPAGSQTPLGFCPREMFENDIRPVVEHPDGVVGQLRANLRRFKVDGLVEVITGDFRSVLPPHRFGFIFADITHDLNEIRLNAPALRRILADGAILACHDTTPENRDEIAKHFQFTQSIQIDSLFIGVVNLQVESV
jgi:predicted O-methyltransferase YrrM